MRAALYTRISRDEAGDGLGVERQQQDCRTLCSRKGWTPVRSYVDNDYSAFSGRTRPAYQELLRDVGARRYDVVVAWAPERLHRSPRELEDFLELVESSGTAVETVKAGAWDVSTSHGRLVARMLGAVSRAESERIGERVSRAHRQAKQAGFWRGPIPYGMRASTRPGCPEPDPTQAAIVERIFERVLRGDALTLIAKELTDSGVRPRRGERWTHTGIARLINSPALGGLVAIDGELHKGLFDGVVAPETWRDMRAALRQRPRNEARRPRESLTLLGGIMRCDAHGHVCVGGSSTHARTYVANLPGMCHVSITRDAANQLIEGLVIARLTRPDARELLVPKVDLDALATESAVLRQRKDELASLIAEGLLGAAAVRPQLQRIADQLAEHEAARSPAGLSDADLLDPWQSWQRWTMPERRDVVRLLFDKISLRHVGPRGGPRADPTRLQVTWAT